MAWEVVSVPKDATKTPGSHPKTDCATEVVPIPPPQLISCEKDRGEYPIQEA